MSDTQTTNNPAKDMMALARDIARQLIDIGAACQRARSFSVAKPGEPLRSVYDVYGERLAVKLHEIFQSCRNG